jgi:hypothetical protein
MVRARLLRLRFLLAPGRWLALVSDCADPISFEFT